MSSRLILRLYKCADEMRFHEAVLMAAKAMSEPMRWGYPTAPRDKIESAYQDGVHTTFVPWQQHEYAFSAELGHILDVPWIELRIQESNHWDYTLYHGKECLDDFSTCPQYYEDDEEHLKLKRGQPQILSKTWGIPLDRIERYLVNWGTRINRKTKEEEFVLKGKAYPDDEFEYGDYEQYFDVLRVLSGKWPRD